MRRLPFETQEISIADPVLLLVSMIMDLLQPANFIPPGNTTGEEVVDSPLYAR